MLWTVAAWPVWVGCLLLAIAAGLQAATRRVPNALTYSAALVAMGTAAVFGGGGLWPVVRGSLAASLAAAGVTFATLLFAYAFWRLGGGCVKAQTAFAAWVGCGLPTGKAVLLSLAAVGVILALVGVVYVFCRWASRGDGDGWVVECSQVWFSALTIATVLVGGVLGMV